MRPIVLGIVLGGCGFQSNLVLDGNVPPVDDGAPGDGAIDGAIDGAPDDPTDCLGRWRNGTVKISTAQELMTLSTGGDERDPWISGDRKTLYFASNREGTFDIFRAERTSPSLPFGPPTRLVNLSVTNASDDRASLSADEKTLVMASERGGGNRSQLYIAVRPDTATEFGSPDQRRLDAVNAAHPDSLDPFLSGDGLVLYLAPDPGGPMRQKIVVATRSDVNSDFRPPVDVPGINVAGRETADPALSPDQRVIVFTSDRDGGRGKLDLWYATRASAGQDFGAPALIPTANDGEDDADPMLDADGCELYFASRRNGGDFDLFVAPVGE